MNNLPLIISGSNDLIDKLAEIYDFDSVPHISELATEMLGCLRVRAGVALEKITDDTAPTIIPLPETLKDNLIHFLQTHLDIETIKLLCATIDLGKTPVFYSDSIDLAKQCGFSTISIKQNEAHLTFLEENGHTIREEIFAMDETTLIEGLCESIDYNKILSRKKNADISSLH